MEAEIEMLKERLADTKMNFKGSGRDETLASHHVQPTELDLRPSSRPQAEPNHPSVQERGSASRPSLNAALEANELVVVENLKEQIEARSTYALIPTPTLPNTQNPCPVVR